MVENGREKLEGVARMMRSMCKLFLYFFGFFPTCYEFF